MYRVLRHLNSFISDSPVMRRNIRLNHYLYFHFRFLYKKKHFKGIIMAKTTDDLLRQLSDINTLSELQNFSTVSQENSSELSFHDYLAGLLEASSFSAGELIRRSEIQRNYAYQILNGSKRPGRDKVVSLCLALSLPLSETQRALTVAGEGILYPKNRRDSILIFCINKGLSVQETNELLYELEENPL